MLVPHLSFREEPDDGTRYVFTFQKEDDETVRVKNILGMAGLLDPDPELVERFVYGVREYMRQDGLLPKKQMAYERTASMEWVPLEENK